MEEYTSQIITIVIKSDIDGSTLLDIAQDAAQRIADEIESYGEDAEVVEEEISVETASMVKA